MEDDLKMVILCERTGCEEMCTFSLSVSTGAMASFDALPFPFVASVAMIQLGCGDNSTVFYRVMES